MKGKITEALKNVFGKLSGKAGSAFHGVSLLIPAVCLGVLVVAVLTGYQAPKAQSYEAAGSDVSQIKEAFSKENAGSQAATTEKKKAKKTVAKGSFDVKDGEYTGSANGYGGTVTVKVTVASKTIKSIDIVSAAGETDSFFSRAKGVIDEIISAQSVDVDVVSGATYSSNGIIGAVKNALYGTESTSTTAAASAQTAGSAPSVSKVSESGTWKDGTYTGSGKGFGGNISVEVTVKDGKITSIKVTSAPGEGSSYLSKAKGLISKMISGQTTNVDAASGATYSSNGLINAVRSALSKAGGSEKSTTAKKSTKKKKKKKASSKKKTTTKKTDTNATYKDGTYTGTAYCDEFEYNVTAKVTITKGKLSKVEISTDNEDKNNVEFINKAKALADTIVSKGGTSGIDVISGATYTSNSIFDAVYNALQKAKVEKSTTTEKAPETTTAKKEDTEATTTEKAPETTTEEKSDEATTEAKEYQYNNGTYTASASCIDKEGEFDYTISADVTIKNDKITSITNVDYTDEAQDSYMNRVIKKMIPKITEAGSATNVDKVSGATYSSNAMKRICQKAFEQAKK